MRHRFDHPRNACTACGHDFTSLKLFDQHRTGRFEPLTRRCLDEDEMVAAGLALDKNGRWHDPVAAAKTRAAFTTAA